MDLARVRREVDQARQRFAYIECQPTTDGKLYVLAALQTSQQQIYTLAVFFPDTYPFSMPNVFVRKPALLANAPHRYRDGQLCYLHPKMWNPGRHDVTFVIARAAKWLGKYEVWVASGSWPGAQVLH
jgi:ubiquitin-protein ligase